MLKLDRLREIYSEQLGALTVPPELVDPIKRAMLAAVAAQRDADAAISDSQAARRSPAICGNCAWHISKCIREGRPE